MPFDFAYSVNEDGNDYSHNAVSDGDVTRGEYRVALPDGRTQIVKYTADWKNGFNAEVWTWSVFDYDETKQGLWLKIHLEPNRLLKNVNLGEEENPDREKSKLW